MTTLELTDPTPATRPARRRTATTGTSTALIAKETGTLTAMYSGAGGLLIAATVDQAPHYAASLLPGPLLDGAGVGFALPAILSSATADRPATQAATGSVVVNMSRQLGTALGVSLVVAVLGSPRGVADMMEAFQHAWWAQAAVAGLAALVSPGI